MPELAHHLEARVQRGRVAEVAAGQDDPVGHLPVELLHDLDGDRLLAFDAQRVHRVGEVDQTFGGELLHDFHAAVEVRIEPEHQRAVRQRLHELRGRDLVARQEHHHGQARRRAERRQRRAGVAGGRAGDGLDLEALLNGLAHDADQHGHAQVFERAAVAVAAQLDPQVIDADFAPVALGPEEIGAAFVHRDDHVVGQLRHDPLALAPHARAVRPLVVPVAVVEQLHPGGTAAVLQGLDVVDDLQQAVALGAAVDRASDRPRPFAAIETAEFRGVRHGGTIAASAPLARSFWLPPNRHKKCHISVLSEPLRGRRWRPALRPAEPVVRGPDDRLFRARARLHAGRSGSGRRRLAARVAARARRAAGRRTVHRARQQRSHDPRSYFSDARLRIPVLERAPEGVRVLRVPANFVVHRGLFKSIAERDAADPESPRERDLSARSRRARRALLLRANRRGRRRKRARGRAALVPRLAQTPRRLDLTLLESLHFPGHLALVGENAAASKPGVGGDFGRGLSGRVVCGPRRLWQFAAWAPFCSKRKACWTAAMAR